MRFLLLALTVAAPAMFAQARSGGRVVVAPARRVAPAPPVRVAAPAPVAVRPAPVVVSRPAPVYVLGYYPNPLYYGAGYGNGYGTGYDNGSAQGPPPGNGAPAAGYYAADPNGQGYPSVIVNPYYTPQTANPVMHDYAYLPATGDDAQASDQDAAPPASAVLFLIAMKDHTIYPAVAYWVENDTLNYITQQGVRNQISLGLIDRDFSTQLNKERGIDFGLPLVTTN